MYAFLGFMLFVDYCVAPVKDQRTHDNNIITLDKFTPISRKFVFVQTIVHTYTHTHTDTHCSTYFTQYVNIS